MREIHRPVPLIHARAPNRIAYLDGLRGVSIVLVLLFHFLGHDDRLPFGSAYGDFFLIREGWVGVEMFFLISGFVILMTLERSASFLSFLGRRLLRLYPGMIIATAFIASFIVLTGLKGPNNRDIGFDLIPGMTFIHPAFYHAIFEWDIKSLDFPFWTLYTEMAFYVIFGAMFFTVGWRWGVALLCALAATTIWGAELAAAAGAPPIAIRLFEPLAWMRFELLGWFAAGVLFRRAAEARSDGSYWLAIFIGLTSALVYDAPIGVNWQDHLALVLVVVIFAATQRLDIAQRIFALRPIVFFGFISYPLYLIHNRFGQTLIVWFDAQLPKAPDWIIAGAPALIVIGLAWLIAQYAEPALTAWIKKYASHFRTRTFVRSE